MSRSSNAAIVRAIRTEYLDTTDEYMMEAGAVVVCPPNYQSCLNPEVSPSLTSYVENVTDGHTYPIFVSLVDSRLTNMGYVCPTQLKETF